MIRIEIVVDNYEGNRIVIEQGTDWSTSPDVVRGLAEQALEQAENAMKTMSK
jgi:hypothetical protein